jgi:hypothetical protein
LGVTEHSSCASASLILKEQPLLCKPVTGEEKMMLQQCADYLTATKVTCL